MALDTLLDLATADVAVTQANHVRALQRADAVQEAQKQAATELETANSELATVTQAERKVVAALGTYATEAEGAALVEERRDLVIRIRALEARIQELTEASDRRRREAAALQRHVQQAQAEVSAAEATLVEQERESELPKEGDPPRPPNRAVVRELLKTTTLPADITTFEGEPVISRAGDRVAQDLQDPLKERARQRAGDRAAEIQARRTLVTDVAAELATHRTDHDGPAAISLVKLEAFERAEADARRYALGGAERVAAIGATLAAIADGPTLNDEQRAAVKKATKDATTALGHEKTLATERRELLVARTELARATRAAAVAAPDEDPANDATVQSKQADADAATAEVTAAETAFTTAERGRVDLVEEALPDHRWSLIQRYEETRAELERLKAVDPQLLLDAWTQAEKELVDALVAERAVTRGRVLLELELALATATVEASAATEQSRTFSAIRGDG